MIRFLCLAVCLAIGLPTVASANVPNVNRLEMARKDRAELRHDILAMRAIVEQINLAVRSGRYCGPIEEIRESERVLEKLEWAYVLGLPSPVKSSKKGR